MLVPTEQAPFVHAGFAMTGTEVRTADVSVDDKGTCEVTSGNDCL